MALRSPFASGFLYSTAGRSHFHPSLSAAGRWRTNSSANGLTFTGAPPPLGLGRQMRFHEKLGNDTCSVDGEPGVSHGRFSMCTPAPMRIAQLVPHRGETGCDCCASAHHLAENVFRLLLR